MSGVLSEEELGQQLHIHELHRDYAACALNLRSYDAISRDVLQVGQHALHVGWCQMTFAALTVSPPTLCSMFCAYA